VTNPSHGTVTITPNGTFTYTPTANFHGTDSFTFRANDGSLNSSPAPVSITVTPINDPVTGTVTLSGRAGQGLTPTATHNLADIEGLPTAPSAFTYQWFAGASALAGATTAALTVTSAMVGSPLSVRVSFTDQLGNPESITSALTEPAVSAVLGGAVHAWAGDRPIPAVAVSLHHTPGSGAASPIDSTSTSTSGAWSFDQLDFDQFSPRAQKTITAHDVKAVSAADVLAALKIAHGRNANADPDGPEALTAAAPSPHQLLSSDLDRDGRVSTADARAILRDAISTTPESAAAVRWIFFDQAQNLSPASRSNLPSPDPIVAEASLSTDVRLIGILLGDVDGSWTPV
ncbi:MAG: cadherin-like domain-containing protein, partial [Burkholderiaceae bacterium]